MRSLVFASLFALSCSPATPTAGSDAATTASDATTGAISKVIGATMDPNLYGIAFENGQVFGFTHDSSGDVVTIDPKTGLGTFYNTFPDPMTGKGISFSGAGVNSMVAAPSIQ